MLMSFQLSTVILTASNNVVMETQNVSKAGIESLNDLGFKNQACLRDFYPYMHR